MQDLRLSELIGALSFALDITEGQPAGHAARSCVIGTRLAAHLGLSEEERFSLFYALLLKDCGCSSIGSQVAELYGHDDQAVKSTLRAIDHRKPIAVLGHAIRNTEPGGGWAGLGSRARRFAGLLRNGATSARELNTIRCDRGADIARMVGLDERGVDGIRSINEHWDGGGIPDGIAGEEIPLLARVMGIAQAVEVELARGGAQHALEVLQSRAGTWFDPSLVADLVLAASAPGFWEGLDREGDVHAVLAPLEPGDRLIVADETRMDRVAEAFARVIDAKSPFTARHSDGVAQIAAGLAETLDLPAAEARRLHRAGLLHDIGKLGVSTAILDKPGKLEAHEWTAMRRHPEWSLQILQRVPAFVELAHVAAAHHERLDGSGYFRGLTAEHLDLPTRILAVADVAEALSSSRPYREALEPDEVLAIMRRDAGTSLDATVFGALEELLPAWSAEHETAPTRAAA
jgi:HD-GYP domain-containing protein (c-di-GMP phosphodiesterase class II)